MTIARIGRNRSPFYGQAAARAEREAEAWFETGGA